MVINPLTGLLDQVGHDKLDRVMKSRSSEPVEEIENLARSIVAITVSLSHEQVGTVFAE